MSFAMKKMSDMQNEDYTSRIRKAWDLQDDLFFNRLSPNLIYSKPIQLRNPFLFYLGHLPSFAMNQMISHLGVESFHPEFDYIFQRGIDPDVDDSTKCHDHPIYPTEWPALDQVVQYRDRVRAVLMEQVNQGTFRGQNGLFDLILEHDLMHVETLYYMMNQIASEEKLKPTLEASNDESKNTTTKRTTIGKTNSPSMVQVKGGSIKLGQIRERVEFGWDNEFQQVVVDVKDFKITALPVTNHEFLKFVVDAKGYKIQEYWTETDWNWKSKNNINHPQVWYLSSNEKNEWMYRKVHGDVSLNDVMNLPVYVSLAEARAYAKWLKKRLPTEAEWQRAAYGTLDDGIERIYPWGDERPVPGVHGNFGFAQYSPVPVGSHPQGKSFWGVEELLGNGWELTQTVFAPLPGFEIDKRYPGYSQDFFDEKHFVVKGASWATTTDLLRPSFRNWYQALYPYVFAKFHLVEDE